MCFNEGVNIEIFEYKSDVERIIVVDVLNAERSRYSSDGNGGMLDKMSFSVMPGAVLKQQLRVRDVSAGRVIWSTEIKLVGTVRERK
jgi:hypothetical protein